MWECVFMGTKERKASNYSGFTLCFWPNEVAVNCRVRAAALWGPTGKQRREEKMGTAEKEEGRKG